MLADDISCRLDRRARVVPCIRHSPLHVGPHGLDGLRGLLGHGPVRSTCGLLHIWPCRFIHHRHVMPNDFVDSLPGLLDIRPRGLHTGLNHHRHIVHHGLVDHLPGLRPLLHDIHLRLHDGSLDVGLRHSVENRHVLEHDLLQAITGVLTVARQCVAPSLDPGPCPMERPRKAVHPVRHGSHPKGFHEPSPEAAAVVAQDVVVLPTPLLAECMEDVGNLHLALDCRAYVNAALVDVRRL
mmetsp:Transcript_12757/g.30320  ORF Transcript_12757/g.30320 Transcript_12757/m.30320 type:complete len:239 (+) Transcript_12757:527-1243(+)